MHYQHYCHTKSQNCTSYWEEKQLCPSWKLDIVKDMWLLRRPNYQRASLKCQGFVLLLLYFCCFWWRKRMWSEKNNFYIKEPKWCCSKPPSVFLTGLIITHPLFAYFHVFTQMLSSQIAVIKQVPVAVPIFCLPFSMIIFCWNDKTQCFLRWWATECARHPTTLAELIQS